MKPPDLALITLLVQAFILGHGAVQIFYEPCRPKYLFWLPLFLIIAYVIFAAFVPPTILDRRNPVTPLAWLNTWRFFVQVTGFTVLVEMLLHIMKREQKALNDAQPGKERWRP